MNVDTKNPLLKSMISENKLAYKTIDSTIDQTMVATTAQKTLDMNANKENENSDYKKQKKKKKADAEKTIDNGPKKEICTIERNPLILLRLF